MRKLIQLLDEEFRNWGRLLDHCASVNGDLAPEVKEIMRRSSKAFDEEAQAEWEDLKRANGPWTAKQYHEEYESFIILKSLNAAADFRKKYPGAYDDFFKPLVRSRSPNVSEEKPVIPWHISHGGVAYYAKRAEEKRQPKP